MQNKKIDLKSVNFQVIASLTCGAAGWQRPAATTWWLTTSFLPRSSNSRRQKVGHRYSNQIVATSLLIFVLPHSEGKCVSGVQSAREYEQVNIFRKKKYDPLSLFILIDDVDNTARWLNDLNIEVKYLSNIPQIISLKWNPQIISLIPNPRSGRGSISSAAFPEHHRVSTWALQQFYSSIKVWKWEKDKKGVTQPLVIKFYI